MKDKMNKIPKDRQIIITTKQGTYAAQWSPADNKIAYANVQIDMYVGKWDMVYFETEYIEEDHVLEWREL